MSRQPGGGTQPKVDGPAEKTPPSGGSAASRPDEAMQPGEAALVAILGELRRVNEQVAALRKQLRRRQTASDGS